MANAMINIFVNFPTFFGEKKLSYKYLKLAQFIFLFLLMNNVWWDKFFGNHFEPMF
jgi:hypothetical protein